MYGFSIILHAVNFCAQFGGQNGINEIHKTDDHPPINIYLRTAEPRAQHYPQPTQPFALCPSMYRYHLLTMAKRWSAATAAAAAAAHVS